MHAANSHTRQSIRRTLLSVAIVLGVVAAASAIRLGWKWQRTIANVDAMIVTPAALPTATRRPETNGRVLAVPTVALATPAPAPSPTSIADLAAPINILLLGTDTRPGIASSRTDALVVVHLDPQAQYASMLALPRDLWVHIPGHGQARVNAAYPIGELQIGEGYGPVLAKETVGDLLGITIDRFVLIDLTGFKALIDQIGGITVDVPNALDDPAFPTDDFKTIAIHFDAGLQQMDGERALIYARTRHADNDFYRNRRQQQVLLAIFDRVRAQGMLTQLDHLDEYTGALRDAVRTDISRAELLSLLKLGAQLRGSQIERFTISPKIVIALKPPATFAADPAALKDLVVQMLHGPAASDMHVGR
jgi:LCP family protein required for cell wall assembly